MQNQKRCKKCSGIKLSLDFHKKSSNKDGLFSICKQCRTQEAKLSHKLNPQPYTKKRRAKYKEWYHANKKEQQERVKNQYRKNPAKHREHAWKQKNINFTFVQYEESLKKQNYCCGICGIGQAHVVKNFSVDHDHCTGVIRGLLCDKCNRALGLFGDSSQILLRALEWLKKR